MKVFLSTMRFDSTRYRSVTRFAFDTSVQPRKVLVFPAGRSSGMRISEHYPAKAGTQHLQYLRILHLCRLAECPATEAAIVEAATTAVGHEVPRDASSTDKTEGHLMKTQSRQSSHETIVKIFRDMGLDDPDLCRRLQGFSKPEIWPRQIARRGDVIITRSNTAPDEGDDDHRKPSEDLIHQDGHAGPGFRPTNRQPGTDQSASGETGQLTACRNPPSKTLLLHDSRISAEYSLGVTVSSPIRQRIVDARGFLEEAS